MLPIWKHCAEKFHYVLTSKLWIMVFHALMHDYDACENIFLKPSSSAKFRKKKIIFHELLISCQFFNDFLI